jgi:hypothetical protein
MRNVFPERTRRGIGLLSVVVALALPACGAASAGTPDGSNTPSMWGVADAGTMRCADVAGAVRRVAAAPADVRPIASGPGSGHALHKLAAPAQPLAVASVPVSGPGESVAVGATAKTASGKMRAVGVASASRAGPCG